MSISRFALVLLAIFSGVFVSSARADSDSSAACCGKQAVQFQISDDFTLKGFNGSLIAYQRFLTKDRAFRLAATVNLDSDDIDETRTYTDADIEGSSEMSEWDYDVRLQGQLLFYRGDGPVRLYYGTGPFFGYARSHREYTFYYLHDGGIEYSFRVTNDRSWKLGLVGTLGLEWAINEHLAVHAEYKATGYYTSSKQEEQRISSPNDDSDYLNVRESSSPEFDSNGVLFGLSVYF